MRRFRGWVRLIPVLVPFVLAFPILAAGPLTYVESSQGLDQPGLEGGNTEVEMVDVNGDGNVDLISVGDHGNPKVNTNEEGIMVWFGDGTGAWTLHQYGHLGYGGVAVGDVDGDGLVDVAYGIHHNYSGTDLGDQLLEVALGDGTGTVWVAWDDNLARDGQSWGMFPTDLGDVDGDGDLDVASTGFGSSDGFHVYRNRSDGTWARSFGFLAGNSGIVCAFGDVDGDGIPDLVTAKEEGSVWLGDGEGFFAQSDTDLPPLPQFDYRVGPSLGDVNGDGRDDLAFCDDAANAQVWLRLADGNWQEASAGIPQTGDCELTQLHDMDVDGAVDLATFGSGHVRVFGGDGAGSTWTLLSSFATGDDPGSAKAFRVGGDVDHNGRPDMALVDDRRVDLFNTKNVLRSYREATQSGAPAVHVVRPGPNRRWLAGSARFIEWVSEVPAGESGTIRIELSTTGVGGPWSEIAAGLPDNGRYQWRVVNRPTGDARLRITLSTPSGDAVVVSPEPFSIARKPEPLILTFDTKDAIAWTDALGRDRWNVYRGDWQRFLDTGEYTQDPATVPLAQRFCDLQVTSLSDPVTPPAGTLLFYLATGYRMMEDGQTPGVPVPMAEGTLGQDTAADTRANDNPCPPPV